MENMHMKAAKAAMETGRPVHLGFWGSCSEAAQALKSLGANPLILQVRNDPDAVIGCKGPDGWQDGELTAAIRAGRPVVIRSVHRLGLDVWLVLASAIDGSSVDLVRFGGPKVPVGSGFRLVTCGCVFHRNALHFAVPKAEAEEVAA